MQSQLGKADHSRGLISAPRANQPVRIAPASAKNEKPTAKASVSAKHQTMSRAVLNPRCQIGENSRQLSGHS